jgi:hypothetical protein
LKGCRWVLIEGHGMVRLRIWENRAEGLFYFDGRYQGVMTYYQSSVDRLKEMFENEGYKAAVLEPEEEVFGE